MHVQTDCTTLQEKLKTTSKMPLLQRLPKLPVDLILDPSSILQLGDFKGPLEKGWSCPTSHGGSTKNTGNIRHILTSHGWNKSHENKKKQHTIEHFMMIDHQPQEKSYQSPVCFPSSLCNPPLITKNTTSHKDFSARWNQVAWWLLRQEPVW